MIKFDKSHEYLLCMDSDGTVMDTMTIKHERAFGPCYLEVFNITNDKETILNQWLDDNLYSKTRGINRFQGLDKIIEYSKQFGYSFDGYEEFHKWVKSTKEFSVPSLTKYREEASNKNVIDLALLWSKRVNEEIVKLPEAETFNNVKETLKIAVEFCDLVGVSSANPQAVTLEWENHKILQYFKFLGCQDKGNKTAIIEQSLENGYDPKKAVMLGDAVGDYEAALKNGIWFFPIIPKYESESWNKFMTEGLVRLTSGRFDAEYQKKLLDEFFSVLG